MEKQKKKKKQKTQARQLGGRKETPNNFVQTVEEYLLTTTLHCARRKASGTVIVQP